jgi:mannose-6-phosphate isomerase-like protein (cupin superfamily)
MISGLTNTRRLITFSSSTRPLPMIHRLPSTGQKLDVAGLNEITVLIDRSETELTEVAMNGWQPNLDGPPHAHTRKEQNFLVTSGRGTVRIGNASFPAEPGSFFYLPAGVVHQTITQGTEPLVYFLFNAFLDTDKEGHASFADHISKVKETRRQQAETQRADADPGVAAGAPPARPGRCIDTSKLVADATVILSRNDTERCEAVHHRLAGGAQLDLPPNQQKEQTLFVLSGHGRLTVGSEAADVAPGQVVFLPRHTAGAMEAGTAGLEVISFGTLIAR